MDCHDGPPVVKPRPVRFDLLLPPVPMSSRISVELLPPGETCPASCGAHDLHIDLDYGWQAAIRGRTERRAMETTVSCDRAFSVVPRPA